MKCPNKIVEVLRVDCVPILNNDAKKENNAMKQQKHTIYSVFQVINEIMNFEDLWSKCNVCDGDLNMRAIKITLMMVDRIFTKEKLRCWGYLVRVYEYYG